MDAYIVRTISCTRAEMAKPFLRNHLLEPKTMGDRRRPKRLVGKPLQIAILFIQPYSSEVSGIPVRRHYCFVYRSDRDASACRALLSPRHASFGRDEPMGGRVYRARILC